jgi:hypothetical protein
MSNVNNERERFSIKRALAFYFGTQTSACADEETKDELLAEYEADMSEWKSYEWNLPDPNLPILLEGAVGIFYARDFDPAMNVYGLRWKPTGIYRERNAGGSWGLAGLAMASIMGIAQSQDSDFFPTMSRKDV